MTRALRPKKGPSRSRPLDMRGITRMDFKRSHSWWVRMVRDGVCHSKHFSDGVYGGREKALSKAKQFRNDLLKKLDPPARHTRNTPFDLPGPGIMKKKVFTYKGPDGELYEYRAWHAWIRVSPSKVVSTKWSIEKWGNLEAQKRVRLWLQEQLMIQATNYTILRQRHQRSL